MKLRDQERYEIRRYEEEMGKLCEALGAGDTGGVFEDRVGAIPTWVSRSCWASLGLAHAE